MDRGGSKRSKNERKERNVGRGIPRKKEQKEKDVKEIRMKKEIKECEKRHTKKGQGNQGWH